MDVDSVNFAAKHPTDSANPPWALVQSIACQRTCNPDAEESEDVPDANKPREREATVVMSLCNVRYDHEVMQTTQDIIIH